MRCGNQRLHAAARRVHAESEAVRGEESEKLVGFVPLSEMSRVSVFAWRPVSVAEVLTATLTLTLLCHLGADAAPASYARLSFTPSHTWCVGVLSIQLTNFLG